MGNFTKFQRDLIPRPLGRNFSPGGLPGNPLVQNGSDHSHNGVCALCARKLSALLSKRLLPLCSHRHEQRVFVIWLQARPWHEHNHNQLQTAGVQSPYVKLVHVLLGSLGLSLQAIPAASTAAARIIFPLVTIFSSDIFEKPNYHKKAVKLISKQNAHLVANKAPARA
jgi:hypothetical protein